MKNNRRDFLKKATLLSAAAALPNVLPESIQRALAINPAPGTTFYDAEHVVFLMQENRSFDHMFGTLKGVRGFNDPHPHVLPNKDKVWLQRDAKGNAYIPFHIDLNRTRVTWQGGLPHSWPDQIAAYNKGHYNNWVPAKSVMCLAYYKREDLPFYYALADAFTICDQYFCSSLTGTTPNRLFFWTGGVRPTPSDKLQSPVVHNHQAESRNSKYVDWPTFPELLEDNDVSWKVYQNEIWSAKLGGETDDWLGNYGDNALEYVSRHRVKLASYFRKNGDNTVTPHLSAAEVLEKYNALTQKEKNLIDKAFATNADNLDYLQLQVHRYTNNEGVEEVINIPKTDIFEGFRKDVDSGSLPTVSWLVAPQRFSDHTSSPLYGTWYVSEALDILTKNAEVWKKTIFIINYDENDGYFDHIRPFVVPKPNDSSTGVVSKQIDVNADYKLDENAPIGLGFRVPMIVASPWSRGGFVNSQVFDHTSALMFLENFLSKKIGRNIKTGQVSSWRRAICGDLTSTFRPYHGEKLQIPTALVKNDVINHIQKVKSKPKQFPMSALKEADIAAINNFEGNNRKRPGVLPRQETGTKPACSLPYDFNADIMMDKVSKHLSLELSVSKKSVGVPFNVTVNNFKEEPRNLAFALVSGDQLEHKFDPTLFGDGPIEVRVHGPNGFFRSLKTDKNLAMLRVISICERDRRGLNCTGNLLLGFENLVGVDLDIQIDDLLTKNVQHVKLRRNQKKHIIINTAQHSNWYNFKITVKQDRAFEMHYSGHIETGSVSTTDPYMAGTL
jgi:phospholipase C